MSIILKGIDFDEITKGNGYARLIIEEDGTVVDDISDIIIGEAIQIPNGHGRLIDGDILQKKFDNYCTGECGCCSEATEDYDCGLIINAPTILEAEE